MRGEGKRSEERGGGEGERGEERGEREGGQRGEG